MRKRLEDTQFRSTLQWALDRKPNTRFLVCWDMDGVVNHHGWWQHWTNFSLEKRRSMIERYMDDICPWNVHYMNVLGQILGAEFLLTSTWRKFYSYQKVGQLLRQAGGNVNFVGQTVNWLTREYESGVKRNRVQRGLEIEDWIEKNVPFSELDNLQLIIVDDDSDFGRLLPWHVRTSLYDEGLEEKALVEALEKAVMLPNAGKLLKTPNSLWI